MKLLLVYCHPDPQSFGAALRRTAADALRAAGHELREIDLYAEGFDQGIVRFCFAKKDETLHTALERLAKL